MSTHPSQILIVDDEPAVRTLLNRKLGKEGFVCDEAEDVDAALAKLRANPPQLIISDIRMPGKSGLELLQQIRSDFPGIAVIVATGVADANVAADCLKLGAVDFITKPFDLAALTSSVRKSLQSKLATAGIPKPDGISTQRFGSLFSRS